MFFPLNHRSMTRLVVSWLLGLATMLDAPIASGQNHLVGDGEILVLRNGNLLAGRIERTAHHYSVSTPQNNRLVVPLAQVDFIAISAEDAYWKRLAGLPATDLEAHQSLFFWCLKYKLYDAAINQLEVLRAIGCQPAQIQSLSKRLEITKNQPTNQQEFAESKTVLNDKAHLSPNQASAELLLTPAPQIATEHSVTISNPLDFFENFDPILTPLPEFGNLLDRTDIALRLQPLDQTNIPPNTITNLTPSQRLPKPVITRNDAGAETIIAQVTYEENDGNPIVREFENLSGKKPKNSQDEPQFHSQSILNSPTDTHGKVGDLSAPQLDALIKTLPAGSFQAFRQRVERHLVFNCGDCHRHQSTEVSSMPLLFQGKYQPLSGRMSQRNIYAVLRQIDLDDPANSPILKASLTAHGTAQSSPLKEDSNEYQLLKQWTMLMSQEWKPSNVAGSTTGSSPNLGSKLTESQGADKPRTAQTQAVVELGRKSIEQSVRPDSISGNRSTTELSKLSSPPGKLPTLSGDRLDFKPKDDFDPEIFNRRYQAASPR